MEATAGPTVDLKKGLIFSPFLSLDGPLLSFLPSSNGPDF